LLSTQIKGTWREHQPLYGGGATAVPDVSLNDLRRDARIARLKAAADEAGDRLCKAYFIGGDAGAIKIGFSVSPSSRLRAIQANSPIPVRILATASGGDAREAYYHARFAASRLHGEWFVRAPEILAEIDRLNDTPQDVTEIAVGGKLWRAA